MKKYEAMKRMHKVELRLRKFRPHVSLDEVIYNVLHTMGINYKKNELEMIKEMNKKMETLDHYRPDKVVDSVRDTFEKTMKFDLMDGASSTIPYIAEMTMESLYAREHGKTKDAKLDGLNTSFRGKAITILVVPNPKLNIARFSFLLYNMHPDIFMNGIYSRLVETPTFKKGINTGDIKCVAFKDCDGRVLASDMGDRFGLLKNMQKVFDHVNTSNKNLCENMLNYSILDVIVDESIIPNTLRMTPLSRLEDEDLNTYMLKGFIDHLSNEEFAGLLDIRPYVNDVADMLDDMKTIQ